MHMDLTSKKLGISFFAWLNPSLPTSLTWRYLAITKATSKVFFRIVPYELKLRQNIVAVLQV